MHRCFASDSLLVIDDFLDAGALTEVRHWFHRQEFLSVQARHWDKVWRLHDGHPLGGTVIHSRENPDSGSGGGTQGARVFPTSTGADRLVEAIEAHADGFADIIGTKGPDWMMFTARSFLYSQGTGLSWHNDSRAFAGSFTWYAHSEWNCLWGGELVLANVPGDGAMPAAQHLDNTQENELLMRIGMGTFVAPKPNRLVIVRSEVIHRINPVHPAAGAHVRASVSGFFVRPAKR
jgi:hypothetical protein